VKNKAKTLQKRDRDKTSGAILSTATALFLEQGYAAVSLSLIAKQAGVTKSLLHHYFGDKQGLWRAVKDASVASYAEQQRALFSAHPGNPAEDIASSIAAYFSFLQKQPEVARMFALESFESDYKPSATEQELQAKGIAFIHDLQKRKVLRGDVDADMVLAVFSALTEHWFISRDRVAKLNNIKTGKALDARYFEAASKVFEAGIQIQ
jgi:TetR/AcrR family transcriptional regulator